jgi:hypothetical protein
MGNTSDVERYLHEHIPLSQHMQVRVVSCDAHGVKLTAPLYPTSTIATPCSAAAPRPWRSWPLDMAAHAT